MSDRRDAHVEVPTLQIGVQIPQVTISITHHAWATWATIAIDHERLAREARVTAPEDELRPALVAITSAAFSLDALYGSWVKHLDIPTPDDPRDEGARWKRVSEATRRVSPGSVSASWRGRIEELYDQRDDAVHFDEVDRPPVWHQPLHSNAAAEHGYWSLDRATVAVDLVLEVLVGWRDSPSKFTTSWSKNYGSLVSSIAEKRRN